MADSKQERYKLEMKIGEGAMGKVWLATDTLLDRPVAIKYPRLAHSPIRKEQLLREARIHASLNHPNIATLYDFFIDEGENRFYLVMEYVAGKPLSEILESGKLLPFDIILDIAMGVLRALSYAHRRGIVHRDIKPANVMIADDVKLADFGLANLKSLLQRGTGFMAGTPAYMAPEQIEGRSIDGRADLYSLGVMLFEMITGGHLPFDYGDEVKLLKAHLIAPPTPISQFSPTVPLVLEHTIMRLLAKDPEDRYPSADVLMNVLDSIHARLKFSKPHLQLLDHDSKALVGRTRELKQMEAVWDQVRTSGTPRLLVMRGEMGIGKSRLVAEFLRNIVDKGFVALIGRCDELGVPYTPFAEILATIFYTGSLKSPTIAEQLERILSRVPGLPPLLNIPPSALAKDVPKDPRQTQWQFFEMMQVVLAELGPTVIFLEDAALLDEASVALTRYLIRHARHVPLLLIAACRDDGGGIPWLRSFRTDERDLMTLQSLSVASIREYLTHLLDGLVSDAVVSTVHKRSDGIPSYIEAIAGPLIEAGDFYQSESGEWQYTPTEKTGPLAPKLMNLFAQRLGKLKEKSRQALAVAAVIGSEFDFDIWLAVLGGDSKVTLALDVLDEALGMRILRDAGYNCYIFHPIDVAQVLASYLTAPRRRHLHRQIAQILSNKQGDPALTAHHYEQAGLVREAARYLEVAGAKWWVEVSLSMEQPMAANAINQAIAHYERAVALAASQESYEALGNLYRIKGAWAESIRAFRQALTLARQARDMTSQARILNSLSFVLCLYDHYKDAYQAAVAVLKLPGVSEIACAVAQSILGFISWSVGRLIEADEWCSKAVETLLKHGEELSLAAAYSRLGLVHFSRGKFSEAKAAFERSLEIRRRLGDYWEQAYCLNNLAKVAVDQGDFESATSLLASAQQLFEKIDSQDGLMVVYTNQARALLRQGRADEALPLLVKAHRLALKIKKLSAYGLSDIYLLIAQASISHGEMSRAKDATDEAMKLVEAAGNQEYIAIAQATLAQIYSAQGDRAKAKAMYKKALALFEQVGSPAGLLRTKLNYAQFLAAEGWTHSAAALEKEARDEAARIGVYL
jgi:serine/threonine protein kinase/tetratricopeptide (TPR) repeat protein